MPTFRSIQELRRFMRTPDGYATRARLTHPSKVAARVQPRREPDVYIMAQHNAMRVTKRPVRKIDLADMAQGRAAMRAIIREGWGADAIQAIEAKIRRV